MWRLWLSMWGFDVREAADGLVATEVALSEPPRLVLMDLSMPVMDGLSAVRRLRADPRTAERDGDWRDRTRQDASRGRGVSAACDLLLEKPIEPEVLLEHMRMAMNVAMKKHRAIGVAFPVRGRPLTAALRAPITQNLRTDRHHHLGPVGQAAMAGGSRFVRVGVVVVALPVSKPQLHRMIPGRRIPTDRIGRP